MSKASSIKQFLLVHSVLANNLSEEFIAAFTSEQAQAIIGDPTRAGEEYEKFLLNGARTNATSGAQTDQSAQVPAPKKPKSRLILVKTVALPALPAKKTAACLVGDHYYSGRDPDINAWLPETQPACGATKVGVFGRSEKQTFAEMFRAALKLPPGVPLDDIARFLKEGKHTFGLQQIDVMVERQEKFINGQQEGSEDVGLCADSYANFVPVEDKDGEVCVLRMDRHDGRWYRDVGRLVNDYVWYPEFRLLLSNSDALKL